MIALIRKIGLASIMIVLFALGGLAYGHPDGDAPLRVYIKDEGFHEQNIVKPRIFVKNKGYHRINNFDLYYYFTVEGGKRPVLETYYTPGSSVRLKRISRKEYCVCYEFRNVNIKPGDIYPGKDGNVVGIHYDDWSPMDKHNDYSNPGSPDWHITNRVDVKIYGR
jgi:hypothetical protein